MVLEPGAKLDRYLILARLGAGGMGEVYRARDARLERDVALKILHAGATDSQGSAGADGPSRILREARSAAALEHPNVIAVYDVGETTLPGEREATAYIAMELIKGRSLRDLVGDRTVPMAERIRYLTDAARALAAAHRAGLVHRDIKPENVMLRDDGVVKVLDFGLARRSSPVIPGQTTSSTAGQVLSTFHTGRSYAAGTPYYMAPEQIRNERIDGRADQFAWGVLAYELLTGTPPWSTDGDMLPLVAEILSDDPTPPREREPEIAPEVEAVVLRALSKSRSDRFASMDALIAALGGQQLASHGSKRSAPVAYANTELALPVPSDPPARRRSTEGAPPAGAASGPRDRRRSTARLAAAGAGLLTLVGAVVVTQVRGQRDEHVAAPAVAAAASAPRECSTNQQCVAKLGAGSICRHANGACATLASADCRVVADEKDVASDDTVWIGTMFPFADAEMGGEVNAKAVDLARRDFAQMVGAIPSGSGKSHARPLGVVSCDDSADPTRAAHHLVDDVGVPAVIGFGTTRELIDLAESLFLPRDVVAISALNTSALVTRLPHPSEGPRRIWRTTYDSAQTAWPLAAFVSDVLEPRVRTRGVDPGGRVRVAFLRINPAQLTLSELFFKALRFNGKSALDNGSDYRELVLDATDGVSAAFARTVDDLVAFAPHILVFEGGPDVGSSRQGLLEPLEAKWPRERRWRPTYVKIEPLGEDETGFVGKSADRRSRVYGITMASNTPTNARLVMHYNQTFHADVTRTVSPNTAYDAFYVLAYAVYALGNEAPTGSNIARAFERLLPPGKPIEVGPSSIFEAFNALKAGQNIDLVGSSGSLDFDTTTGQAPTDDVVLCVGVDDKGGASEAVESGLVYDATAKKLVGSLHCP